MPCFYIRLPLEQTSPTLAELIPKYVVTTNDDRIFITQI